MRDWKNQVQLHIYIISKHKSTYACLYTHHFALSTIFLQLVFISLGPFLYCCLAGDWNCSSSTLTSEARWGQTRGGGGRAYLGGHSAWTACHSKGSRSASLLQSKSTHIYYTHSIRLILQKFDIDFNLFCPQRFNHIHFISTQRTWVQLQKTQSRKIYRYTFSLPIT